MKLIELKICYVEQFGFDVVMGDLSYINLTTILQLRKILEEDEKEKKTK